LLLGFVCTSNYSVTSPSIAITSYAAGFIAANGLSGGAIAGIIIGSVAFVAIVVVLIWLCCRKKGANAG